MWSWIVLEDEIKKREFVIEYVGEVIDDRTCENRLWTMKRLNDTNFYLCELQFIDLHTEKFDLKEEEWHFLELHIQTGVEVELHCSGIHICLELLLGIKLVCYGILANYDFLLEKANEGNSRALLNAEPSNIGARLIVEQCFSCYCYLQLQKVVLELKVILSTLLLVPLTAMPKEV
ncbi:unnamed protein product [Miscanthus lutarioriparius]|uniref:Uncharacterized protein n=1 Tax=Miscanthus lutarioriparius TaxID=422564 RepID=A0A811NDZ5_9POAL|nr:unnamed protein product [Miscanthus lutarioriparius]